MQAAFQQLLQSPGQVQRLMQLLSSGSTNGSTPITAPITGVPQSGSWAPSASLDLPQLSQLALYDNGIGGGSNNALTFDNKDTIGPSTSQLAEDEARLAHSYHDASEIDADVDVLQANISALIENMGLDPAVLASTPAASTHLPPPLPPPSSEGVSQAQTTADFDFDAFLTAFANAQDGESGAANLDDKTSASESVLGTGPDATNVFSEQPLVIGRKRTSDVAELSVPLQEPSKAQPSRVAKTDATASELPRVKRNKK
jgi:heat shock transcription factor